MLYQPLSENCFHFVSSNYVCSFNWYRDSVCVCVFSANCTRYIVRCSQHWREYKNVANTHTLWIWFAVSRAHNVLQSYQFKLHEMRKCSTFFISVHSRSVCDSIFNGFNFTLKRVSFFSIWIRSSVFFIFSNFQLRFGYKTLLSLKMMVFVLFFHRSDDRCAFQKLFQRTRNPAIFLK